MTVRRLHILPLAIVLLCSTRSVPAQTAPGPFKIVKSFPVSEPTWGGNWGDLYLVAAERSVLVYRKTGSEPSDYELVNTIYPAHDADIANCVIEGDFLYMGAKAEGLLAYRLKDLAKPGLQPAMRFAPAGKSIGWVASNGGRIFAALDKNGVAVLDAKTLTLLGEGQSETQFGWFAATAGGVLYAGASKVQTSLTIIDARDPKSIATVKKLKSKPVETEFFTVPSVVGQTLYTAEFNGGIGEYDISDPLNPVLRRRYDEQGPLPSGGRQIHDAMKGIRYIAVNEKAAFPAYYFTADAVGLSPDGMQKLAQIYNASTSGRRNKGKLARAAGMFVRDNVLAMPTTVEGIRFYDVSNPAQPRLLLLIDLPTRMEGSAKVGRMLYVTSDEDGVWQLEWDGRKMPRMRKRIPLKGLSEDLVLYKKHLYVANGEGLATIDVAKEDNPHLVDYWEFPYVGAPSVGKGWIEGVDVADGTLYVAAGPVGVAIFDVKDPAHPKFITTFKPGPPTGWKKPNLPFNFAHDVTIDPKRKLLAYGGTGVMALIDVSNPAKPKTIGCIEAFGASDAKFAADGIHLAVCEGEQFRMFDISDPTKPVFINSYPSGPAESVLFYKDYVLAPGRGEGINVYKKGKSFADMVWVQNIPSYFYNSKFFVQGKRIFTNCQGMHELRLK